MTREQWKKMTDIEKNVKIAEICGWTELKNRRGEPDKVGCNPSGIMRDLPDYLNDLNAMHEAEKMLKKGPIGTHSPMSTYRLTLYRILEADGEEAVEWGHATAEQRAEAFVMTMDKHCCNCGRPCAGAPSDDLDPCDKWSKRETIL